MKQSKKRELPYKGKIIILLDTLAICLSLLLSWLIRSQFNFFIYHISKFIFLFPWVLFSRLFFHFFFEIYSFSLMTLRNKDISRLFKYNSLTTIILLLLRAIRVQNEFLIMPFSMIAMEYLFSTFGFIVIRLFLHSRKIKKADPRGYRRRILIWSEIKDIKNNIDIDKLGNDFNIEVIGILNANPLFWNQEYEEIRIYGDESELRNISVEDDRVSTIAFCNQSDLTMKQKVNIIESAAQLHMELAVIDGDSFNVVEPEWIIEYL